MAKSNNTEYIIPSICRIKQWARAKGELKKKMIDIMQPLLPGWTEGKATDQEALLLNINTDDVVYRHEDDGKIQLERPSRGKNVPDSKPPPGPSRARDKVTAPKMTGAPCT